SPQNRTPQNFTRFYQSPYAGRVIPLPRHEVPLIIARGLLFSEEKLLPVEWITNASDEEVNAGVRASFINRLPAYDGQQFNSSTKKVWPVPVKRPDLFRFFIWIFAAAND